MRIVILSSLLPVPPEMPGSPRLYSLARRLSTANELILMVPSDRARLESACGPLSKLSKVFEKILFLPSPPKPGFLGRNLHRISFGASYETKASNPRYHACVKSLVQRAVAEFNPDLVLVHSLQMVQYLPSRLRCSLAIDLVDSLSLFFARRFEHAKSLKQRIGLFSEVMRARALERRACKIADRVAFVSDVDAAWVKSRNPAAAIEVVPNGIDFDYFVEGPEPKPGNKILFVGSMNYPPNEDAAIWFCQSVFPEIKRRKPSAEFWIVGAKPSPRVSALNDPADGIYVTGTVDDVRPYYQQSSLLVCPMRLGSGLKNKILQAIAMRVPVLATSLAFDGLNKISDHVVWKRDDAAEIAETAVALLEKMQANGPEINAVLTKAQSEAIKYYSWQKSAEILESWGTSEKGLFTQTVAQGKTQLSAVCVPVRSESAFVPRVEETSEDMLEHAR